MCVHFVTLHMCTAAYGLTPKRWLSLFHGFLWDFLLCFNNHGKRDFSIKKQVCVHICTCGICVCVGEGSWYKYYTLDGTHTSKTSCPVLRKWCDSRHPVVENVQQLPHGPWVSVCVCVCVCVCVFVLRVRCLETTCASDFLNPLDNKSVHIV